MATLVLTTVGTLIGGPVGGPVGGSIGAALGQAVDARLFAPKGRDGPRLSDLRLQTSSYGTPIPRLYGRMRVAGTVIWATDLVEHRQRQGGKGQPTSTRYSYSASFAVALSSRPIHSVGRIWAEGNLLRGAAGDFKSAVTFRLYDGDEDQPVDPLIASAEGVAACPAFRGIAYAMFEDMDLSPFGNRIPSLSFEVVADKGAGLSLAVPMAELLGSARPSGTAPQIAGAALSATSRRAAVEPLVRILPVDRETVAMGWRIGEHRADAVLALGEPRSARPPARARRTLGDAGAVPRHVSLSLFDPARDWQLALYQTRVAAGLAPGETVALPLAMDASSAKATGQRLAREAARQVRRCDWPAGFAALAASPGTAVLAGDGALGRVAERRIEGAGVQLLIEAGRTDDVAPPAADGGRVLAPVDQPIGASRAWLFDLPWIDGLNGHEDGSSRMVLAAGGEGAGWRQATVNVVASAGALPVAVGRIGAAAVLGEVVAIEGAGQPWLFDRAGAVTVELLHDMMQLGNADDAALIGGANLAVAGDELFQFGHAQPMGARRWRLTHLLRGRFGTEDAMARPAAGRGFAMVDDVALMPLPVAVQRGGSLLIEGVADARPLIVPVTSAGRALRPYAPVRLVSQRQDDGGLVLGWTRRSRIGSGWQDLLDAPLDEREERYLVTLTPAAGGVVMVETAVAVARIDAATVASWRAAAGSGAALHVDVVQIGASGVSPPLSVDVRL